MMSHLEMAMLLLALVIAVLVATRPAPPRRRPHPMRPRDGKSRANGRGAAISPLRRLAPDRADAVDRNRWDRADIATGVGRDYAQPDPGLNHWPAPR